MRQPSSLLARYCREIDIRDRSAPSIHAGFVPPRPLASLSLYGGTAVNNRLFPAPSNTIGSDTNRRTCVRQYSRSIGDIYIRAHASLRSNPDTRLTRSRMHALCKERHRDVPRARYDSGREGSAPETEAGYARASVTPCGTGSPP